MHTIVKFFKSPKKGNFFGEVEMKERDTTMAVNGFTINSAVRGTK